MIRFLLTLFGLFALAPCAAWGGTGTGGRIAAPAIEPSGPIVRKARSLISLGVKLPENAAGAYFLDAVMKDGHAVEVPENIRYQSATGEFAWEPTESQVGSYEIRFAPLLGEVDGPAARVKIIVKPRAVCARGGEVCKLLDRWYKEGTASGNTGDFYDNRDNGHSRLNTDRLFPQLDRITYPEETVKTLGWALQRRLLEGVVFGNSSTSAGPTTGGSNPRQYYRTPAGLTFLFQQYRNNNLYVYPEHRDYDPGHNGRGGGYGDLYPANTSYLLISQGSSGSDQPFLRAIASTLAAFRPEVKARLVREGLLMPTLQMVFRRSNKQVADEAAYLSGPAHPTVFDGKQIDALAMVRRAHDIRRETIPPMVRLKVLKEDESVVGKDFFEPPGLASERLADTPSVIARVVRGPRYVRTMVVSAEESFDENRRELTWHWRILRGDREKIEIVPKNEARSVVELRVAYQPRAPIGVGESLESNRVDIGVFVHNGSCYSAPGFVTFYTLDREDRTYTSDGRLLEIDYRAGSSEIDFAGITDWAVFLRTILEDGHSFASRLLKGRFSADALGRLREIAGDYQSRYERAKNGEREPGKAAGKAMAEANRFLRETKFDPSHTVAARLLAELNGLKDDPTFFIRHLEPIRQWARSRKAAEGGRSVDSMFEELLELGVVERTAGGLRLNPLLPGRGPAAERLSRFQRSRLQRTHLEIFNRFLFADFMNQPWTENYCDEYLTAAKPWRDLYRYAPDGTCLGWLRAYDDKKVEFNTEGHKIVEKDSQGRATKVQTVIYRSDRTGPRKRWHLECLDGDKVINITYRSPDDTVGVSSTVEKSEDVD